MNRDTRNYRAAASVLAAMGAFFVLNILSAVAAIVTTIEKMDNLYNIVLFVFIGLFIFLALSSMAVFCLNKAVKYGRVHKAHKLYLGLGGGAGDVSIHELAVRMGVSYQRALSAVEALATLGLLAGGVSDYEASVVRGDVTSDLAGPVMGKAAARRARGGLPVLDGVVRCPACGKVNILADTAGGSCKYCGSEFSGSKQGA
jgi:hypothetical protein